ncbi:MULTISPECIES: Ig-like domain-containing protein [unclassified Microbulbifer]|uniref:Ig-like domain-containing protein n=1 Tax=unclassified Microbulbifer TaxID=2619833 RepID=UPI0027E50C5F|nr:MULTISPECIES: Ig-like domain-containing protein [unclassified Microbulbifer]
MKRFNGLIWRASIALLLPFFVISPINAIAYCSAQGNNTNYEWIDEVSIAGTTHASGKDNGYADYTNELFHLSEGANSITLTPGFNGSAYTENWKIWIDFDNDTIFSDEEAVFSGASNSELNGSISIPNNAVNGTTRMRVALRYGGAPQPCGSFTYGEVEDYTVYLDTTDVTSPTIVSKSPAADAVDVSLDSIIAVTFSEDIDPLTVGDSSISVTGNGYNIPGTVTHDGNLLTFSANQFLDFSTVYTVTVSPTLQDLAGNPLLQNDVWSFTTAAPDTTAPSVLWTSPEDGASDISNNYVVQVRFSEPMDPASINTSTFTITDGIADVSGSVVLASDEMTVQFYSDQPFDYLTTYTGTITTGVQNASGIELEHNHTWSFTSREYQPDYCSSYASNYSDAWVAAVQVGSYTHSSPSQPGTGYSNHTGTIFELSRHFSREIDLTPGYNLSPYTTYWRVFIDWNQDGSFTSDEIVFSDSGDASVTGSITTPDNALAGNTRMRVSMQSGGYPGPCGTLSSGEVEDFRINIPDPVADTTPPSVNAVTPTDGAANIPVNSSISVTFSEEMDVDTLSVGALTLESESGTVDMVSAYDPQLDQVVFMPVYDLEYGTVYTATLHNSVADVAGNAMTADFNWSFETAVEPISTYVVSGAVSAQGVGIVGVTVSASGDSLLSTTTDANGQYALTALPPGSYTITPSKSGYSFSPANVGVTITDSDISAVDYTATASPTAFVNGDFEQGNFSGYNSYTTSDGVFNKGIVSFDIDQDGANSTTAYFSVGTDSLNSMGTQQGGGIYQNVGLGDGDLYVTMDIAASASSNNGSGGLFELYFDGELMDSHDFDGITSGITEYATLSFELPNTNAGNHEIRIQVTRPYMQTNVTNYLDNITLTGSSVQ